MRTFTTLQLSEVCPFLIMSYLLTVLHLNDDWKAKLLQTMELTKVP